MANIPYRKYLPLLVLLSVFGCGGGGSDSSSALAPDNGNPPANAPGDSSGGNDSPPPQNPPGGDEPPPPTGSAPDPVPEGTAMTMSCVDGAGHQCSGTSIVRIDNGVALTSAGVQAYGISTNDLVVPSPDSGSAYGLATATGGLAEVRVAKDGSGVVSSPTLLLNNFGISWDGTTERPPIVETFSTTKSRVLLGADGRITVQPLPDASNLDFYDYAVRGENATQAHYANNVYFPRTDYPVRCPAANPDCPEIETPGFQTPMSGDWRTGGQDPDIGSVSRLHAEGDLFAGDDLPAPDGTRRYLPNGDGFGVSYPGFKGYRSFGIWNYRYGNLASWETMDTVNIVEFAGPGNEHNKNRRGMVAFGDVTDPASIPDRGSATYVGYAYGWYSPDGVGSVDEGNDVRFFRGNATLLVNFATRQVTVTFSNTMTFNAAMTPVPVSLTGVMPMGPAGANTAGYLTGTVDNGSLRGGLSGRYFGPVVSTGSSGAGPAEVGGAFSMSNASTGAAAVGGFIGRKQ